MSIFGSLFGGDAAKAATQAAGAQVTGLQNGMGLINGQIGTNNAAYSPYTSTGTRANDAYESALGLNGADGSYAARQAFQESPGYQFTLGQGVNALDNSAAANGSLYSGGTAKALTGYGQGLANQEWGGYLDRLGGLGQQGLQATGQLSALNSGLTSTNAQAAADIGTARATGIVGAANAKQSAFNNILGTAGQFFGFL